MERTIKFFSARVSDEFFYHRKVNLLKCLKGNDTEWQSRDLPPSHGCLVSGSLFKVIGMDGRDPEQEIAMQVYVGLFLITIGIGYLIVRFFLYR